MISLIIKKFVPNYNDVSNPEVRERYGMVGGLVGMVCNLLLFVLKLLVGLMAGSIAVISDAFNNLSDLGSSLISVIGAKISSKSADSEHPYGHGRAEYISALIISFLIILFGVELIKSSVKEIFNPERVASNPLLIVVLIISIIIKLWMWRSNIYMGKRITSKMLKAAGRDSLNDAIATSVVAISAIASKYVEFSIDAVAGLLVSVMIIWSGIGIAKETVGRLLGEAPSEELIESIEKEVMSGENILGIHDLMVHDYGPGKTIASVHAEVPESLSLTEVHTVIDKIEHKIMNELNVDIVIHMDPIADRINQL